MSLLFFFFFFFNDTATTEIYTLSLHDALPISLLHQPAPLGGFAVDEGGELLAAAAAELVALGDDRSEEHTSELQSHSDLVCRLLLEKKKNSCNRPVGECGVCLRTTSRSRPPRT